MAQRREKTQKRKKTDGQSHLSFWTCALGILLLFSPSAYPQNQTNNAPQAESPYAGVRIAVIDVNIVFNKSRAWTGFRKVLEKEFEAFRENARALQTDLEKRQSELHRQQQLLDRNALQQREQNLQETKRQYETQLATAKKKLDERNAKARQALQAAIVKHIETVTKDRKLDLVLHIGSGRGVVVASPDMNITEDILALLNQSMPSLNGF